MSIIFCAVRITFDLSVFSGLAYQFITALGFTFETNFGCWPKRRISSISPRTPVYPNTKVSKVGAQTWSERDDPMFTTCGIMLHYIVLKLNI